MRQVLSTALALAALALAGCAPNVPSAVLRTEAAATPSLTAARALMATAPRGLAPIPERQATVVRNVAYGRHAEQGLDIYGTSERQARRPVVVWVHGGGWKTGDKSNGMDTKRAYFKSLGYVLVSINYRLADPSVPERQRAMHPVQIRDVCAAIGWVKTNIGAHGGDPAAIALMGHSAGGHLVSLAGTHPTYLAEAVGRQGLGALKGVISVDSACYELTRTDSPKQEDLVRNAFGTNVAVRRDASPVHQVASGRQTPPFLVTVQGSPERISEAFAFHQATRQADPRQNGDGFQAVRGYDHNEMSQMIGVPGEQVVTPPVTAFLRQAFGR
ncbi:MAG: alpha/beta hydrolase [Candidatus Sericytochromatia bacterium]|nr:alpha/beta hydrolase [Candidatus Sericytochromatia bacterium]